eukprot:m.154128 g.154128  ORF g.154128 m.154128 type:complete len:245 (+) comp38632_c0_seq19:116-850(+)
MRRSVCFVKRLQLHFKGNVFSQALCLGDVDNDGRNECAIGNVEGCLAVFKKAKHDKPWRVCNDLGTIACVGVGDLCGIGKNVLVSISSEGQCHIFYLEKDFEDDRGDMKPVCTQRIPANVRALLLADIAGDGVCHLAVGHTDRVVRVYEWVKGKLLDDTSGFIAGSLSMIKKWSLEAQRMRALLLSLHWMVHFSSIVGRSFFGNCASIINSFHWLNLTLRGMEMMRWLHARGMDAFTLWTVKGM